MTVAEPITEQLPSAPLQGKFVNMLSWVNQASRVFIMNFHTGKIEPTKQAKVGGATAPTTYKNSEGQTITCLPSWFALRREEAKKLWPMYLQFAQADHFSHNKSSQAQFILGQATQQYGELPAGIEDDEDIYTSGMDAGQAEAASQLLIAKQRAKALMDEAKEYRRIADAYMMPDNIPAEQHFMRGKYAKMPDGVLKVYANKRREERHAAILAQKERKVLDEEIARAKARQVAMAEAGVTEQPTVVIANDLPDVPIAPQQEMGHGQEESGQEKGPGQEESQEAGPGSGDDDAPVRQLRSRKGSAGKAG